MQMQNLVNWLNCTPLPGGLVCINSACWVIFHVFFSRLLIFFNITLSKIVFQEQHQSVKHLDPDQARLFVGPDMGPNCLQRLSADDKIPH